MATIINESIQPPGVKGKGIGGIFGELGTDVDIAFQDATMEVRGRSTPIIQVDYSRLTTGLGGFNDSQIFFHWREGGDAVSVIVDHQSLQPYFSSQNASAGLSQLLDPITRGLGRRRRSHIRNIAVISIFVVIPLLLLFSFFSHSDRVAQWVVNGISIESEEKLGDLFFEQMRPQLKLLTDTPREKLVADIGGRISRGESYTFQWHVAEDPTINAFAMPGGHVVVYTGLLKAVGSPEELAGVLAHEIQHVIQRHSLKAAVKNAGLQAVVGLATGNFSGGVIADLTSQLGGLKFSRDAEFEADVKGLEMLRRSAIDPNGMIRFFEQLDKESGAQITLLSTHPASADRIERLKSYLNAKPFEIIQPLDVDWASVRS